MRATLLALLALVSSSSSLGTPPPSTHDGAAPLCSAPDVRPTPPDVLDLLGRCRDELPALGCAVGDDGHGSCDPASRSRFVALDLCDASGAFATGGADGYVCGVRWSDCLWCAPDHALVLPWRAGPWPADVSASAPWSRRAAACLAQGTARSSALPHSST